MRRVLYWHEYTHTLSRFLRRDADRLDKVRIVADHNGDSESVDEGIT